MKRFMGKEKGVYLLQVAASISVMAILGYGYNFVESRKAEQKEFQVYGNHIATYTSAVAEWVVDQGGAAIPATHSGSDWLKSNTDCGISSGGSTAYLPCGFSFSGLNRWSREPTSTVQNNAGVTTVTVTWPAVTVGGSPHVRGIGYAVFEAQSAQEVVDGVVQYSENDTTGVISAQIDVNNSTSIYVKKSGDTMTGPLAMSGNNISGVGVLTANAGDFSGNLDVDGNITAAGANISGAATLGSANIAGTATMGSATVNGTATMTNATVTGNANLSKLGGNLEVTSIATAGAACSPNRRLAVSSSGALLTCQSGTWKDAQGGGKGLKAVFSPLTGQSTACLAGGYYFYARVLADGTPQYKVRKYNGSVTIPWTSGATLGSVEGASCRGLFAKGHHLNITTTGLTAAQEPTNKECQDEGRTPAYCTANWSY